MKKINIIYLAIIPLCYLLYQMNNSLGQASAFFYGFAENKETELSHDKAVAIHKILVAPGQEVSKGHLLMKVKQSSIDYKIDVAGLELEELKIRKQQRRQELTNKIEQLKTKLKSELAELNAQIQELEANIAYNKSLMEGLKSLENEQVTDNNSSYHLRLKTLKESKSLIAEPINIQIAQLQKELNNLNIPSAIEAEKIKSQIDYFKDEQNQLAILAPTDGLIGNILCKEGENVPAFKTLINFYERNPTIVKGYVHESLILQVKVRDSLLVSSTLHPELQIQGIVTGLGSRIVEIPERLRKVPEVKTYGREVIIRIPPKNPFLQKEKVMLNSLEENSDHSFVSFFSTLRRKIAKEDENISDHIRTKADH